LLSLRRNISRSASVSLGVWLSVDSVMIGDEDR
jgi:hypothetical protein